MNLITLHIEYPNVKNFVLANEDYSDTDNTVCVYDRGANRKKCTVSYGGKETIAVHTYATLVFKLFTKPDYQQSIRLSSVEEGSRREQKIFTVEFDVDAHTKHLFPDFRTPLLDETPRELHLLISREPALVISDAKTGENVGTYPNDRSSCCALL